MKDLPYAERLSELGLHVILIVAFSMYKGRYDLPLDELRTLLEIANR